MLLDDSNVGLVFWPWNKFGLLEKKKEEENGLRIREKGKFSSGSRKLRETKQEKEKMER